MSSSTLFHKKNFSIVSLYPFPENPEKISVLSASSQKDKKSSISVLDLETRKEISVFHSPDSSPINAAAISGNLIIIGTENGNICGFSEKSGKKSIFDHRSEGSSEITSISVNFGGNLLASGVKFESSTEPSDASDSDDESTENAILFYDLRTGSISLLGAYKESHSDRITALSFHPTDSDLLSSGGEDGLVNVFDLKQPNEDDALKFTFNCGSAVSKIGYWKSNVFATTDDGKLFSWTTDDGEEVFSLELTESIFPNSESEKLFLIDCFQSKDDDSIFVLATDSDGRMSGSKVKEGEKKGVVVFDRVDIGHTDMIRCILWDDRSNRVITGGDDGMIVSYDMTQHFFGREPTRKRLKKK